MGVLGLAPFLLKTCPEVLKPLPRRLKSLSGKTLVIDGTLITQRLHFAPMPQPYKHVLGWYRIISELREAGVQAICVFDGKERNSAKQAEVERRRETRRMTAARGQLELERLKRLCALTAHVKAWRTLDPASQESASCQLRDVIYSSAIPLPAYTAGNLALANHADREPYVHICKEEARARGDVDGPKEVEVSSTEVSNTVLKAIKAIVEDEDNHIIYSPSYGLDTSTPKIARREIPATTTETAHTFLEHLSLQDADPARMEESFELVDELPRDEIAASSPSEQVVSADDVRLALVDSYMEYRASVDKLSQVSEIAAESCPITATSTAEDSTEARTDHIMSKTQYQLTVDEGKFWNQLIDPTSPEIVESAAVALAEKSSLVSNSYERRTHPPTHETYKESMEVLQAMGVPCLESNGPFEAEALASSLVLRGLADYVATEDTDVIVYGAPMLRNLTRRDAPLVIVRGEDVCATLELDRRRFIDFALLLGTDFSQRIKNVGPRRALKFIREHGTIEKVLEHETQFPPRVPASDYLEQVTQARNVFETLPPTPDAQLLQPLQYDEELVHQVLRRYGLASEISLSEWDYTDALAGNYFEDNPSAS